MTSIQVQEDNSTLESQYHSGTACVPENFGIARDNSKDGSTDKDVTAVSTQEVGTKR